MSTPWITPSRPTATPWTGRPQGGGVSNTVSPIITGIWNDINTWTETGKFWNDSGDIAGLVTPVWTERTIPNTSWSGRIIP